MTHRTRTDENCRFNIRIVEAGDAYGRNDCLTHDDAAGLGPMVEFYDSRYTDEDFGELGQFVSRYYVDTLEESATHLSVVGLCLDGGVPEWNIDGAEFAEHWRWILEELGRIER